MDSITTSSTNKGKQNALKDTLKLQCIESRKDTYDSIKEKKLYVITQTSNEKVNNITTELFKLKRNSLKFKKELLIKKRELCNETDLHCKEMIQIDIENIELDKEQIMITKKQLQDELHNLKKSCSIEIDSDLLDSEFF